MAPHRNRSSNSSQNSNQNNQNNNNINNNNSNRTCRNCGRTGHLARECRSNKNNKNNNNNNNNNNDNDRRNNRNSNESKKCDNCSNGRHNTNDCKKTSSNQDNFCEWHNKDFHTDKACGDKKNPKSSKYDGESKRGDKDGDVRMEGYAFAQPFANRPIASNVQYCRLHNTNQHTELNCPEVAYQRSLGAGIVCWKCSERGHLGDECRNPSAKFCYKCHKSGHDTTECSKKSKLDEIRFQLSTLAPTSGIRNKWPQPAWEGKTFEPRITVSQEMREELRQRRLDGSVSPEQVATAEATIAEQERLELNVPAKPAFGVNGRSSSSLSNQLPSWKQAHLENERDAWYYKSHRGREHTIPIRDPSRSLRSPRHYPGISKPYLLPPNDLGPSVDHARVARRLRAEQRSAHEKAVRAKVLKSRTMYKLHWANQYIRDVSTKLLETQTMTRDNLWRVHKVMAQNPPVNIFRDPEAVQGVANLERPFCNRCFQQGTIVDRWFNDVPTDQDVVGLEDWEDWGVFVAFDCQCCKREGWTYERLERAEVAMEIEVLDAQRA